LLSYRHAFHAGNHADVLKHFVLMQVLQYFAGKDKPFWYVDTHAGAGIYALDTGYAAQNAEYASGIGRLWERADLPPPLAEYVALVHTFNAGGKLRFYPGSPACARPLLNAEDRMRLFELHTSDVPLLWKTFKKDARRVIIEPIDGFAGLKALLPPPPRRAVVLIDPSYEQKQDYTRVIDALTDGLQRFATGTYILWYPLLQRPEPKRLQEKLAKLGLKSWLSTTLTVQAPALGGYGMQGSGLFIVNPPWTLPGILQETLPYLARTLGQDAAATYTLEHVIP
jgi:23S rRNA (adenine2030-N6)-methyltransferase